MSDQTCVESKYQPNSHNFALEATPAPIRLCHTLHRFAKYSGKWFGKEGRRWSTPPESPGWNCDGRNSQSGSSRRSAPGLAQRPCDLPQGIWFSLARTSPRTHDLGHNLRPGITYKGYRDKYCCYAVS